eukprot:SAG11_NODE_26137_length_349_cov_0.920000_1_plen_59_part_10
MPDMTPRTPMLMRRPPYNSTLPSLMRARPEHAAELYVPKQLTDRSMDGRKGFGHRKGVQ